MLPQPLSRLGNCPPQSLSEQASTSEVLKRCYYHILSFRQNPQPTLQSHSPSHLPKIPRSEYSILPSRSFAADTTLSLPLPYQQQSGLPYQGESKKERRWPREQKTLLKTLSVLEVPKEERGPRERGSKENRIRKKVDPRHCTVGLGKDQRYFETTKVSVDPSTVGQLGLYQASQLFKSKNLANSLQQLTVVAQPHQFNPIRLNPCCDLFVTTLPPVPGFSVDSFLEQELGRHQPPPLTIPECDSIASSREPLSRTFSEAEPALPREMEKAVLLVTIRNYEAVEDESFALFRARHSANWGVVRLNLQNIIRCLRSHRILQARVKANYLTTWEGQRTPESKTLEWLGLSSQAVSPERVERQVLGFRDRLKVAVMRRRIQRRGTLARWVVERLRTRWMVRRVREQKLERALEMQAQLRLEPEWEVEIFLPSFSVDGFKRNTTQYMEWFQSQYHCLWERSYLPLILVLPTLNEQLLSLLQAKVALLRPVTIITPEIYSVFPPNLSLAAQVFFSYETLTKLQRAVGGRRAVLLGGPYSEGPYESLISEHLDAPINRSLRAWGQFEEEKFFFREAQLPVPLHCLVPPETSPDQLLRLLAGLLVRQDGEKSWVIKISGEFRGRGIATLRINPSRCLKGVGQDRDREEALVESLRSGLRLKLRVNFQNSVYMVDDFLQTLQKRGGLIEENVEASATYELCFYKARSCEVRAVFRTYGTNFNNKLWLSGPTPSALTALGQQLAEVIQQQQRYLGHLSATVFQTPQGFVGIDLKFGQTPAAGLTIFAEAIKGPSLPGSEAVSLSQLPTRRVEVERSERGQSNSGPFCLFIPAFPFTDIEEEAKAKLIQELMQQCWGDRQAKAGVSSRLFLSLGLDFAGVLIGGDLKRLKREAGEMVRQLSQRSGGLREYQGKQVVRDVFEFGEVIRAISQIRVAE